ncbi:WD40 repeat domain-containing protein [Candidatus Bipolaricaulota bacterium]
MKSKLHVRTCIGFALIPILCAGSWLAGVGAEALAGPYVFDQISTGRMAVYSNDRERLMIVDGGEMAILDAETLAEIVTISLPGYVNEFGQPSISPDGLRVAASVSGSEVCVWSLPEGTQIARLDISAYPVPRIYFTPSGKELVVLSGMRAELRDAGTGELLRVFEAARRFVNIAAVSPDGTVLVTGDSAGAIRLWDVSSGALIAELAAHVGDVTSLEFITTGESFVSAGLDGSIRLWDTAEAVEIRRIAAHSEGVGWLSVSSDGRFVASSSPDATARIWDVATGGSIATLDLWEEIGPLSEPVFPFTGGLHEFSFVFGAEFGPGNSTLVVSYVSGFESIIGLWDLEGVL